MKTLSPLPPSQLPSDPFLTKHLLVGAQYDTVIDNLQKRPKKAQGFNPGMN